MSTCVILICTSLSSVLGIFAGQAFMIHPSLEEYALGWKPLACKDAVLSCQWLNVVVLVVIVVYMYIDNSSCRESICLLLLLYIYSPSLCRRGRNFSATVVLRLSSVFAPLTAFWLALPIAWRTLILWSAMVSFPSDPGVGLTWKLPEIQNYQIIMKFHSSERFVSPLRMLPSFKFRPRGFIWPFQFRSKSL